MIGEICINFNGGTLASVKAVLTMALPPSDYVGSTTLGLTINPIKYNSVAKFQTSTPRSATLSFWIIAKTLLTSS